jgi:hypothetical protein
MSDSIKQVLERWTNAEEIRLRAGEIDPETMITVLAVTRGMAFEIEEAIIGYVGSCNND